MSAFVEIGGERYELAEPSSYNFDEAKIAKAVSGMNLAELEMGIVQSDADAWLAVALVTMRRVNPKVAQADVVAALRKQPLLAILESLEDEKDEPEEVDDPRPPALPIRPNGSPGESDKPSERKQGQDGEMTPATTGDPT